MEEILKRYGFNSVEPNIWKKDDWTVRIDNPVIEIFNDPDENAGKYYIGQVDETDLNEILTEVDNFLKVQKCKSAWQH